MSEYITPNYEVISVIQKRDLMKLMNSSLPYSELITGGTING